LWPALRRNIGKYEIKKAPARPVRQSFFRFNALHNLLLMSAICGLFGCAPLPPADPQFTEKGSGDLSAAVSFNAPAISWPNSQWWLVYQDDQLAQLEREALAASPDLAMAQARVQRAEAAVEVAGAPLLPQASAVGAVTAQRLSYNYLTPEGSVPRGWNQFGQAAFNISWEIDFWGKNRAGLAAATSELEARLADRAQAALVLTTATASAYAEFARLFAQQEATQRAVAIREKTAGLFAERFTHGLETRGGVREADAKVAQAKTDLLLLSEQIALQRNRLAALVGAGPDRGLVLTRPRVELNQPVGLPERIAADLLGRRPDVVAARVQAQAQAARIKQKQADFYPNINLAGLIGLQSLGLDRLGQGGSLFGIVGPAISLPIFTGGRLQGELKSVRATYDEAVANYNRTLVQAFQDVADALTSLRALTEQLEQAELGFTAAQDAFEIASNRYRGGLSNFLDVLIAEDIMLSSLRSVTDLRARRFSLNIGLVRALGGGYQSINTNPLSSTKS
jgi:NodT family efflux transporter outer membrane factor (OMF) lipoprotein